tara:strand:- start:530 stop:721 length:192 start_codon:yes stop_codon:yes gene_type:complete
MNMISKDYFNLAGVTFDTIIRVKDEIVEVAKDHYQVGSFNKGEFLAAVKRSDFKISDIPRRLA